LTGVGAYLKEFAGEGAIEQLGAVE